MNKREPFKNIEIAGRKWRIGRFDAMTGSYILYKILTQALPSIMSQIPGAGALGSGEGKSTMSKEDFLSLQRDCLNVCMEITDVGGQEIPTKVVMPNGTWGVPGIEDDMLTVMALTVHVLVFNLSSFFDGDALKSITDSLSGLNLFSAKK